MRKQLIAGLAIAMAAMTAYAGGNSNNSGNTTNNYDNRNYGGAGGAGGTGVGVGVGVGIGQGGNASAEGGKGGAGGNGYGGSVVGSGNSSNHVSQGQQQGQAQSIRFSNTNSSVASSSTASGANAINSGNNATTMVSVQGDDVRYEAAKIPVATAYAPNIVATALCKFGVSGGGQGMTFGFSVGVSITDENCMLLEQVRTVSVVLGQKEVAQEMMMAVPAYAEAVKRLNGKTVSRTGEATGSVITADVRPMGAGVSTVTFNDQDPIIRSRLGLPPLTH